MKPSSKFNTTVAIIAVILALGTYFYIRQFSPELTLSLLSVPIYMALVVMYINWSVTKANEKSPARFITAFMGGVTIKLLITAASVGIFAYLNKGQKVEIALVIGVVYIIYTIILVSSLLKQTAIPK
jgi:hypothetical protein